MPNRTAKIMQDKITVGLHLTLGEAIYILRKRSVFTLEELADRAKVNTKVIESIERDDYKKVRMSDLVAVGYSLGLWLHVGLSKEKIQLIIPMSEVNEALEDENTK